MNPNSFVEKFNRRVKEIDRSIWGKIPQIKEEPLYDIYKRTIPTNTNVRLYVGLTRENADKKLCSLITKETNRVVNGVLEYLYYDVVKQGDDISVYANSNNIIL